MIRHQDKILVCMSGGPYSLALLHTLHQYQFYARAKGIHFTIGMYRFFLFRKKISEAYCNAIVILY